MRFVAETLDRECLSIHTARHSMFTDCYILLIPGASLIACTFVRCKIEYEHTFDKRRRVYIGDSVLVGCTMIESNPNTLTPETQQ